MLTLVSWFAASAAVLPLVLLSLECLAGLRAAEQMPAGEAPPFAVLVPAHDEAIGIAATVAAVQQQLRACDLLLVVADHCRDATAAVAQAAGAIVAVRDGSADRGKGHALAFGRAILRDHPRAVVIVLDADCVPDAGALAALASAAHRVGGAVQGRYLLITDSDATPRVRLSAFAFRIKNRIRQRGLQRLGGSALLQGSGMAFPWHVFDRAPLATSSLVEDLELGLELVLAGEEIRFADDASFTSRVAGERATRVQRTRWEHGALAVAGRYLPRLLLAGLRRRPALLVVAGSLLVPPLALLVTAACAIGIMVSALAMLGADPTPLVVLAAATLLFAGTLSLVWHRHGRDLLPAADLAGIPLYLWWKLPIYARLFGRRERRWIRTERPL